MNHRTKQSGFSLLELLSVVAILGLLSTIGAIYLSPDVIGNYSSGADAHTLVNDLQMARRRAIATGHDHRIRFITVDSKFSSYEIEQIDSVDATITSVDSTRSIAEEITVTVSSGSPRFDFEGQATTAPTITVAGPDATWQLSIIPVSGYVSIAEI